jgi:hypothetical protein
MSSYLALLVSAVIGGLFLMNMQRFQSDLQVHSYRHTNDLIVQQNAMEVIDLLEWDLRRIGLGADTALALCDSNRITFFADLDSDGIVDQIRYTLSDPSAASGTPNPNDRLLYRSVNGEPDIDAALGVTGFRLRYFDANGNSLVYPIASTNFANIQTIEVTLQLDSTLPDQDEQYSHFIWQERITPNNLTPW